MNVLLITGDYFPIKSPRSLRATELSKELVVQGHKVDILTHKDFELHDEFEKKYGIKIINFSKSKIYSSIRKTILSQFVHKILAKFHDFQYYFYVKQSVRNLNNYDAVITISVPFSLAWGLASFTKKKIKDKFGVWIADMGDPFMKNKGIISRPLFILHYFEWNTLLKADFITVPFSEMREQFYKKFRFKIVVIPQGVQLGSPIGNYSRKNTIRIGYSGYMYHGTRDVFPLIDYLILKCYKFEFHIFTNQRVLFQKYQSYFGTYIFLYDYISRDMLIYFLSELDFLVAVNFDSVDGVITAIPSKLIDYAETKRPILFYENSQLPLDIIDEFMHFDFTRSFNLDLKKYDISVIASQFISLIQKSIN